MANKKPNQTVKCQRLLFLLFSLGLATGGRKLQEYGNKYKSYTEEHTEKSNEDEILQKLLQKVAKRKRRSEPQQPTLADGDEAQDVADTKESTKKRKKSKDVIDEAVATPPVEKDHEKDAVEEDIVGGSGDIPDDVDNEQSGFQVLGEDAANAAKREKVEMVLPPWLAHPTIISTDLSSTDPDTDGNALDALTYLQPHIRHSLKEMKITRLFPVQSAIIPWILEGHSKPHPFRPRDICVSAPTGSGKTLAFAIPIVQLLANRVTRRIQALIVLPVAELALQVYKVFKKLCEKTELSVCLLSKQFAFPLEQEKLVELYKGQYYSKVDIVVTTPGRLVDHLHSTKGFCVKSLKFLVIDEADRIMDAVFQNWLYHLDGHVRATSDQLLSGRTAPLCYNELELLADSQPHKLLFSATLSQDPEKLQSLRLFQPKLFTSVLTNTDELREKFLQASATSANRGEFIGKYTTPAELTERYCLTESRLKPLTLYSLVREHEWTKFLCFTNSAEAAKRLAFVLGELFKDSACRVAELSATMSPSERSASLSNFARGKIHGLVCSDALARGIDIPDVDIVVSYDPPRHVKTYIHRIGRTARAGRKGTAIMLLNQKELGAFNVLLGDVGKELTDEILVTSANEEENARKYTNALETLRKHLEREVNAKKLRKVRAKEAAHLHKKDPAKMTLMEKMQMKAGALIEQAQTAKDQPKKPTVVQQQHQKKNANTFKKKFNASAGKSLKIRK